MTRNERVQELLSQGLCKARSMGMKSREEGFCAAYLAGRLADCDKPEPKPHDTALQKWMWANPKYVYGALSDIDSDELADVIVRGPQAIGIYVLGKLRESMIDDLESQDPEPDREAEHDYRQRVRDAKDEEEEWLGVC